MEGFKNIHPLTKLTVPFTLGMLSLSSGLPLKTVKSRGLYNKALTFCIFQISIMKTFVSSPLSLSNSALLSLVKTESSPLMAKFFDMLQKDYSLCRAYKCNKIWKFFPRVLPEQRKSPCSVCKWQGKSPGELIQNSIMKESHSFSVIILSYVSVHFPLLWHSTNSNPLTWRDRLSQAQELEMEEELAGPGATRSQHIFKVKNGRGRFSKVGTVEV